MCNNKFLDGQSVAVYGHRPAQHLNELSGGPSGARLHRIGSHTVVLRGGHAHRVLDLGDTGDGGNVEVQLHPELVALHSDQGVLRPLRRSIGHLIAQRLGHSGHGDHCRAVLHLAGHREHHVSLYHDGQFRPVLGDLRRGGGLSRRGGLLGVPALLLRRAGQDHQVVGAGLAGIGGQYDPIPSHHMVAHLDVSQSSLLTGIGGHLGVRLHGEPEPAVVGGDGDAAVLVLGDGLHFMVLSRSYILGDVAHHREGGGLRGQRAGGYRAVVHIDGLTHLQGRGVGGGVLSTVDPHGLRGDVHDIFPIALRGEPQAGDVPGLIPADLLDLAVVQLAVRQGLILHHGRIRLCEICGFRRHGGQGCGAQQGAADQQSR